MSVEHMALVLHHSKAKGTAKLILLGIANHMGDGGAWPSMATLALYGNCDVRSAQRSIEKLQGLGEVRVHVQQGGTRTTDDHRRPNRYDVNVLCPPWCDRSPNHRDTRRYQGQPSLWTNPVTPVSPGDTSVTPPVTPVSPPRVTPVPPEPPIGTQPQPRLALVPQVQTARADCSVCGQSAEECIRRAATSGHAYKPRQRDAARLLSTIHDQFTEDNQ